jgi:toxin ParE1/3/4
MLSFKLSAKAKVDLKKIAVFTEKQWGRDQRNTYLLQIDDCFRRLTSNPQMGATCNHIKTGYRQFPQGSHLIFYKISNNDTVQVIRILHKSMLPKFHFTKK